MEMQSNGGLHIFLPYIYKFTYEFDLDTLRPRIDAAIENVELNSSLEKGGAVSTVSTSEIHQPHTWLELHDFQTWLGEKLTHIKDEHNFYERQSTVMGSWFNRHFKGGYTLEHSHNFTTWVASCYVLCPPNTGNIEFKDPLEYHKTTFPIVNEMNYTSVQVQTNDVLIFPGWLKHKVQPNETDQERIVMTFNIK